MDLIFLLILILFYMNQTLLEATNDHVVYAGSCVGKPVDFCAQKVENSICNPLKNECFCKKGYVAIREDEDKVSCKTLLTDLKCRMDKDCYHVNKSTCHPGAGYCSCPGHTIYSSELHACRSKAYHIEHNRFCRTCHAENGVCFLYEPYDNKEKYFRVDQDYIGCACPIRTRNQLSVNKNKNEICNGNLVDVGDYCNEYRDRCRAKLAKCLKPSSLKSSEVRICRCPDGYVRVYQSNLHYHECFPILAKNAPQCALCFAGNGQCYDINNDGIGDGCLCSPLFSNPNNDADFKNQNEFCSVNHLKFGCSDRKLQLCYTPHTTPPYEYLGTDLMARNALVHLIGNNNKHQYELSADRAERSEFCQLKYQSNKISGKGQKNRKLCILLDLFDEARECGIRSYKLPVIFMLYIFLIFN